MLSPPPPPQRRICLGCVFYPVLSLTVVQALDVLYLESSDSRRSSQVTAVFVFVQEFEQELAEQKSLLRSVASRGEEILTQSSAVDSSEGLGYALKVCSFSPCCVSLSFEKLNLSLWSLFTL